MSKGFQGIIGIWVSLPFDKILHAIFDTMGVQNILDFVVFMIVLDIQWQWGWRETMQRN